MTGRVVMIDHSMMREQFIENVDFEFSIAVWRV